MNLSEPFGFQTTTLSRHALALACAAALRLALWPVVALLAPVACAETPRVPSGPMSGAPDAAANISAIALEQGCFGCTHVTVLVLQKDGAATLTATGNARHGSVDRVQSGSVSRADFQALARLAIARGFFEQPETIDNPQERDGPWRIVRVTRNGQDKQVFWREGVAAPALASLTRAIEALQARTSFVQRR